MSTKPKVAVIGLGHIGKAVAANLSKSNRTFFASDRNIEKAKELSAHWGASALPSDIPTAVKNADIVVLAIPFGEMAGFVKNHETDLAGKIVIDPSNPLALMINEPFEVEIT